MNAWLSWRPDERIAQVVRGAVRRGTQLSHHLFSVVGGFAVVLAIALWLMPTWRGTLAAKLMPVLSAAVQAGPARLLQGNPLPAFGPPGRASSDETLSANTPGADAANSATSAGVSVSNTSYDGAFDGSGSAGMGIAALNGLDPRTMQSVSALARLIPAQRVSADARDDRVLVSSREQALVASYLARRYRVAQEPVGELVKAAFDTGREVGLDPLLLLSVMAIESGFNPYAESGVGAQGLMQVMSKVHSDKFQYFGGESAALQPLANIKVGALVLKDCIARGGSLPGGLRLYVGSTSQDDGGYGAKVMAERARLRDVARGRKVPINAPQAPVITASNNAPSPAAAPTTAPAAANNGNARRVQVTLDGSHPLSAAAPPAKTSASEQDDASASAPKHVASTAELGA
ncbi:lytic transglycosylase domain-containing protein [bacterium M00.F.Ca.ET.228.01.1.1]|uniref:lytic transglycosylase domain-containing protein n=1 Tax=Paraburkholderia phenoliruptrix TaxID=252970 RepID=UPI001091B51C|nr:lytic transglycosylase domain-containing protein [Paraburkholderia phenoliruptrix]TGP43934.1 lytic transglycosylase domain-containing protein [bacterium M00.F.Ca.ET.228.01.1.1]TGS01597.1 lytic transglycosylase domain-containing protein [bacterium M00.F.Ca.ET.191.01.1.1]TGU08797.1 lytic transglycosylase domain-containing protein [bacterium M00.F.Ca.ET.155.01.1.1]MBW0448994.1 lytic transglycosylase domain-containing protein [Paraburkholderia phenoliruptrix]MBW9097403.1 lytic transglycosylase 